MQEELKQEVVIKLFFLRSNESISILLATLEGNAFSAFFLRSNARTAFIAVLA